MESSLTEWIALLTPVIILATFTLVSQFVSISRSQIWKSQDVSSFKDNDERPRGPANHDNNVAEIRDERCLEELNGLKLLYYELHNIENFPEALGRAKNLLICLLRETRSEAERLPECESILSLKSFSRKALRQFQHQQNRLIGKQWEDYNIRRGKGGSKELFDDRNGAIWWLKQISPVKLVDGAWLGHIGRVTTPFQFGKTMKGSWQILSEELGDGDLEKNHVHVYHELLRSVSSDTATPDTQDFIHPRHRLECLSVWKAAIAQLIISLFPDEFLPEILGFNLHFEAISMETLKAAKELKEVGIDPYYFILHVSIDNSHSGHSALAIEIVCEYMDQIIQTKGEMAAKDAWEKIKGGYLLSSGLPGNPTRSSQKDPVERQTVRFTHTERDVIEIFKAKAQEMHGVHCCSRVRIGDKRIAEWLDPIAMKSELWQRSLLNALSSNTYWITKGDSTNSRFIRELQWSGRMFGSFTQIEYDTLRDWIDALPNISRALLKRPSAQAEKIEEERLLADTMSLLLNMYPRTGGLDLDKIHFSFNELPTINLEKELIFEKFLPLWLSHPCLLQGFVTIPFKTSNIFACHVVKALRAQKGFDEEQECVAGLTEFQRPSSLGLLSIGLKFVALYGYSIETLQSLEDVLQIWPSQFARHMLFASLRPNRFRGFLLGMATAFAKFHALFAESHSKSISHQGMIALHNIARRELLHLKECWKILEDDSDIIRECFQGFIIAKSEIEKCFRNG